MTGWINGDNYQSIHVAVIAARNLRSSLLGAPPDPYCEVTVDSTSMRSPVCAAFMASSLCHQPVQAVLTLLAAVPRRGPAPCGNI